VTRVMYDAARRQRVARALARLCWQPDKWERLTLVARMVGPHSTSVLDVGGRAKEMAFLLKPTPVVSVNIEPPADVVTPMGERLPFEDGSFDVVTSTDVLEHIPASGRQAHIDELVRISRRRVVLCCPLGSPEKDAAERQLARRLRDELDLTLDFLEEHIAYGLPREAEIRAMVAAAAPDASISTHYQDGVDYGVEIVMNGMRAARLKDVRALVRFVWAAYIRRKVELVTTPSADASRLFMVLDR